MSLWGELEPVDHGQLPAQRDSSSFNEHTGRWDLNVYFMSLDVEEGWLFVAGNRHLQIWDARATPPAPVRVFHKERALLSLTWLPTSHPFFIFEDVDAPEGDSDVLAVAARHGIGLAIFDTRSKTAPRLLYQDHGDGRWGEQVHAATLGGRQVAFLAAEQQGGAFAYDLTAARSLATPCVEARPGPGPSACPGVFLGRLGNRTAVKYLDGAGDFLALSSGTFSRGLEIWNVAVPGAPVLALSALTGKFVYGVALWQSGSSLYLAATTPTALEIFDLSCLETGGPCSLGAPLWTFVKPFSANVLTFSRSGDVPFLYLAGGTSDCLEGNQNEWLFDVRDPVHPRDVSPPGTSIVSGQEVSYWGWYYRRNGVLGYNHTSPQSAKFGGSYLFRAAKGTLDIHRWIAADLPFFADGFDSGGFEGWDSVLTGKTAFP